MNADESSPQEVLSLMVQDVAASSVASLQAQGIIYDVG
jgi:hypothetical protein